MDCVITSCAVLIPITLRKRTLILKLTQVCCLWLNNTSNSSSCVTLLRDVIKRIDQSEFEGFEYINPLLTDESV